MSFLLSITIFTMLVMAGGILNSYADEVVLSAETTAMIYDVGVFPGIKGTVTNSMGQPLDNVYIYSFFSEQQIDSSSRSDGSFFLRLPFSFPVGEHSVDVYARSGTILSKTTVTFEIQKQPSRQSSWLSSATEIQVVDSENYTSFQSIKNHTQPDIILQQIDIQGFQAEEKLDQKNNLTAQLSLNDYQRKIVQENLQQSFLENSREIQKVENKNAYGSFVSTLDLIFHAIFWDQFKFTEEISDKAFEAKISALEEGKTSYEAMKVYQNKAATPQKKLIAYMEEINIKHGFTNSTVQEQFDENGKIPRNPQN